MKGKAKANSGGGALNLGRAVSGETKVKDIVTYNKQWVAKGGRQQSENVETHEVTGVAGRFVLDLLRAVLVHQTHKLTTYSFAQAVESVLAEETEVVLPEVLAAAPVERVALHGARRRAHVRTLATRLRTLEESIELARLTGLSLRTVLNQAQGIRLENLMLKAARKPGYALPVNQAILQYLRWPSTSVRTDARAYQHFRGSGTNSTPSTACASTSACRATARATHPHGRGMP